VGLVEDAAVYFPASVGEACRLSAAPRPPTVQKDAWHLQRRAGQLVIDADRITLAKLAAAEKKARLVRPGFWILADARDDGQAEHAQAETAIAQADALRLAADLLGPALAAVDARTGQILDHETAAWYLDEIVAYLRRSGGRLGRQLAGTITRQAASLLTFHGWLGLEIEPWRARALGHFQDPALATYFERAVAHAWLRARERTNGRSLGRAAKRAEAHVAALCANDPVARELADGLWAILEGVVRTSSAVECLNSLLRAYLWARRSFGSRRTAQNWLNLLVLWHIMRPFERGKRAGRSPFQSAGVRVFDPQGNRTHDWLTALGFPAAA